MPIKSLTIYCSSSNKLSPEYYNLADNIGKFLAKKSITLIYGGGKAGIMGRVSNSAHKSGGKVIGIIPKFLSTKEKINREISEIIIVKNMTERKKLLFEMGDAFLILPGGSGTIEEATEIISWKLLKIHNKKIILFNFNKFWDPLIQMYNDAKIKKFGNKNLQTICKNIDSFHDFKKYFS